MVCAVAVYKIKLNVVTIMKCRAKYIKYITHILIVCSVRRISASICDFISKHHTRSGHLC